MDLYREGEPVECTYELQWIQVNRESRIQTYKIDTKSTGVFRNKILFPNQTKGVNSARTIDVTRTTGTQQQRPESPTISPPGTRLIQGVHKLHERDILINTACA